MCKCVRTACMVGCILIPRFWEEQPEPAATGRSAAQLLRGSAVMGRGSCSVRFKLAWAIDTSGAILPLPIYYLQLPDFNPWKHSKGSADAERSTWLVYTGREGNRAFEKQGELMTNKMIKLIIYGPNFQKKSPNLCHPVPLACKLPEDGF